jgi:hypothetical protein
MWVCEESGPRSALLDLSESKRGARSSAAPEAASALGEPAMSRRERVRPHMLGYGHGHVLGRVGTISAWTRWMKGLKNSMALWTQHFQSYSKLGPEKTIFVSGGNRAHIHIVSHHSLLLATYYLLLATCSPCSTRWACGIPASRWTAGNRSSSVLCVESTTPQTETQSHRSEAAGTISPSVFIMPHRGHQYE